MMKTSVLMCMCVVVEAIRKRGSELETLWGDLIVDGLFLLKSPTRGTWSSAKQVVTISFLL